MYKTTPSLSTSSDKFEEDVSYYIAYCAKRLGYLPNAVLVRPGLTTRTQITVEMEGGDRSFPIQIRTDSGIELKENQFKLDISHGVSE